MNVILENKEICAACGGKCCKKCGCDYAAKDFENLSINYLQKRLEEGNISIVSTLEFEKLPNRKIICVPHLYLRVRNTDRPIVDLLSLKTRCSVLKEDGCPYTYENRPSGAKNVIPQENFECLQLESMDKLILKGWEPYQRILSRLVKRLTGNSVDEQLTIDVENFFETIKDMKYENVSEIEKLEALELLPLLAIVYKEQFNKVFKPNNKDKCKIINKKDN